MWRPRLSLAHVVIAGAFSPHLAAQPVTYAERIAWFQHDKFGMFIHWGPYSYLAGEWNGNRIPVGTEAEWIMQRFNIPASQYREMAHHLNPVHFDANGWVALAKATSMKFR